MFHKSNIKKKNNKKTSNIKETNIVEQTFMHLMAFNFARYIIMYPRFNLSNRSIVQTLICFFYLENFFGTWQLCTGNFFLKLFKYSITFLFRPTSSFCYTKWRCYKINQILYKLQHYFLFNN